MKCYDCLKEINEINICPYCEKSQIYETLNFNVKGATSENEEGKDIQKEIRKIFLEYERNGCFEKYGGYTNEEIKEFMNEVTEFEDAEVEIKLKEDMYENKPCIKIYLKKYDDSYCHIGFMPKGLVKRYLRLKQHFKEIIIEANMVGGKIKQLEYDYVTEKDKVEVIDLTYGFEVFLTFYNDERLYNGEIEKKKQEVIESYNKKIEEENKKKEENQKIRNEKIEKENRRSNIIIFFITAIVSAPFIWLFWKILSFVIDIIFI